MVVMKWEFVLLLIYFHESYCQRRIINGSVTTADKPYMVYLVKATMSDRRYDSWICGGALVTREFILTSAACVEDVKYMYAVAGYVKYVADKFIPYDDCTKDLRKRIVYTCIPVTYQFSYDEIEKWSYIDIALVKVESPYDFEDARFQIMCSYVPKVISINYDPKRQAPNTDAIVLGWGHKEYWRKRSDKSNYNQKFLRYTAVSLMDKEECKAAYQNYPEMQKTIDKYMICSILPGNLNDVGEPIVTKPSLADGCVTSKLKMKGATGPSCEVEVVEEEYNPMDPTSVVLEGDYGKDETRRQTGLNVTNDDGLINQTEFDIGSEFDIGTESDNGTESDYGTEFENGTDFDNGTDFEARNDYSEADEVNGRRNGICQNDHGGPLVTWVGAKEVLIGVASVFKITEENECIGPFLYTSTMCNGAFIECVLNDKSTKEKNKPNMSHVSRELCDSPASVKGFDMIETYVSWKDHPGGPADNEIAELRGGKPKKKRVDKYATRHVSSEDKRVDPKNPLSDRYKPKMSYPIIKEIIHRKKPAKNKEAETERPRDRFDTRIGPPPPSNNNYKTRQGKIDNEGLISAQNDAIAKPAQNYAFEPPVQGNSFGSPTQTDPFANPPFHSGVFSGPAMTNEAPAMNYAAPAMNYETPAMTYEAPAMINEAPAIPPLNNAAFGAGANNPNIMQSPPNSDQGQLKMRPMRPLRDTFL